jgi:TIR domain
MPYEVFISYSHKDRPLLEDLAAHLSNLRRQKIINPWFDTNIGPGTEWNADLTDHLEKAQIILLLISASFMASDFCHSTEMERAMERHYAHEARVIPIILRPVDWKGAPFSVLQALPSEAKPVTKWSDPDEAFTNVVKGIRRAIEDLDAKAKAPNP